jgi:enoyl-CoA hydratase/carnithine racemase
VEESMMDAPINAATVVGSTSTTANGRLIGILTLNAAPSLNALTLEMIDQLTDQLEVWADDPRVAMVMLEGSGDKAFCAGGDLRNLYESMRAHHASGNREDLLANGYAANFFGREYRLDYAIHTYPKPILCWGHGIVMGGGMGLMAGASHRVVTETSRLAMPEVGIGLFPDVGGSWFLNRMPGRLGVFLALTGASIGASDAIFVKLADHLVSHANKAHVVNTLLNQPWCDEREQNDALLGNVLRAFETSRDPGPLRQHFDAINTCCAHERLQDVLATLTALETQDPWLNKALTGVRRASPTALSLAWGLQRKARHLSLADVFRLEYAAALACAAGHDFSEGIRALIIDKDQRPQWQSATSTHGLQSSPWPLDEHPLRDLGRAEARADHTV